MRTIILKWNPAFSSYTILRYLNDLHKAVESDDNDRKSNWSVRDYDKVRSGDRFFMLKVGFGQTGIVMAGRVTSNAYRSEDWSFRERPTWYVDYVPDVMINPDGMELLTSAELADRIPGFDWYGGHSGIVLSDADGEALEAVWQEYLERQSEKFELASDDNLFMASNTESDDFPYEISFENDSYDDDITLYVTTKSRYFDKILTKRIDVFDLARLMKKMKCVSRRELLKKLHAQYPDAASLQSFCAFLYDIGINFRTRVYCSEEE